MRNTLNSITINRFRKLKDIHFDIAKRITVIAGHNGIGKSTILGLIANGSEMKGHKSYFDKIFQAKFEEIFRLDPVNDFTKIQSEKYSVILKYSMQNQDLYKFCTVTSHKEKEKDEEIESKKIEEPKESSHKSRLKIVPRNSDQFGKQLNKTILDVGQSAKTPIPTLYIGMSRVIPIGESSKEYYNIKEGSIEAEDINQLNIWYREILGEENLNSEKISKQNLKYSNKKSIGPSFEDYSYEVVSLGQDSLSSILTALLSFRKLKRELGENYTGGILVIDEIDACLHPYAQEKLIKVLDECAKNLDLQIICTTHSLTIIKNIISQQVLTSKNPNDTTLYYNVVYIKDIVSPNLMKNPTYIKIKNDMFLRDTIFLDNRQEIKVYFEDKEGQYLFNKIEKFSDTLDLDGVRLEKISAEIGCDTLIKLPEKDDYFKTVMLILDGDVNKKQTYRTLITEHKNICSLPGKFSPEETIYTYLNELINKIDHPYWRENQDLVSIQLVRDRLVRELELDLSRNNRDDKARMHYKNWFKKYQFIFDKTEVIKYWMNDYSKDIIKFIEDFNISLNFLKSFQIQEMN